MLCHYVGAAEQSICGYGLFFLTRRLSNVQWKDDPGPFGNSFDAVSFRALFGDFLIIPLWREMIPGLGTLSLFPALSSQKLL